MPIGKHLEREVFGRYANTGRCVLGNRDRILRLVDWVSRLNRINGIYRDTVLANHRINNRRAIHRSIDRNVFFAPCKSEHSQQNAQEGVNFEEPFSPDCRHGYSFAELSSVELSSMGYWIGSTTMGVTPYMQ